MITKNNIYKNQNIIVSYKNSNLYKKIFIFNKVSIISILSFKNYDLTSCLSFSPSEKQKVIVMDNY